MVGEWKGSAGYRKMKARFAVQIVFATCIALGSILAFSSQPAAVIVNSGSTNTPGFQVSVERTGEAEYTATPHGKGSQDREAKPIRRKVPDDLARRFFSDLEAARPLSALPREHCMKSASFGTTLTIELDDEETPDLSCPSPQNSHIQTLKGDVTEIVKIFSSD